MYASGTFTDGRTGRISTDIAAADDDDFAVQFFSGSEVHFLYVIDAGHDIFRIIARNVEFSAVLQTDGSEEALEALFASCPLISSFS